LSKSHPFLRRIKDGMHTHPEPQASRINLTASQSRSPQLNNNGKVPKEEVKTLKWKVVVKDI
jgi:hypothetical protein